MDSLSNFQTLKFQYEFRLHQKMMLDKFEQLRRANTKKSFKYHLVSPPGSGKTIIGLEMAIRLGVPALIICPNTAIQGQWAEKLEMFSFENSSLDLDGLVSTDSNKIKAVNIFTYQMLSVPVNDEDSFIRISENLWAESTYKSLGISLEEALLRIVTMKETNPSAYKLELSKFNRKLRQNYLNDPNCSLSNILHPNTLDLINKLKENQIGTIIFDECHHLQNYWALIMKEIAREINAVNIIGLTATPPVDEEGERLECYAALLGEIDYQIPTPAEIKEGMLAPYQDLVYFCTPTRKELEYIENCHSRFKELIDIFDKQGSDFYFWIESRITLRKLITGDTQDWTRFINSKPRFAIAGVKYLMKNSCRLPWDITITDVMYERMDIDDWICLIEDYSLNLLKLSSKEEDKSIYNGVKEALKSLGYILTEKGVRSYSSPIDRILAYSTSKLTGVREILKAEMASLGDKIRVAVITDFEISNALDLNRSESILDKECGGAVKVMKELVSDPQTGLLDPVMITAKNLFCDNDLAESFVRLGTQWIQSNELDIVLSTEPIMADKLTSVTGMGKDWNSRTAVLLTTHFFENGITKCIIGTRGLLSEGWDSLNLNTLIDLTAVTTFASVNQLRGRSIRKSESEPLKVSNNWDVICIAPGLEKGYNDLNRLFRKHEQIYGVCDDGQIQKGINHLDPSIDTAEIPFGQEDIFRINKSMLEVVMDRKRTYRLWRVGEPFENKELGCCELKIEKPVPMKAGSVVFDEKGVLKQKIRSCFLQFAGLTVSLTGSFAAASVVTPAAIPILGFSVYELYRMVKGVKDLWGYGKENFFKLGVKFAVSDVCKCLLGALGECEIIDRSISEDKIIVTERSDGSIRVFLDGYDEASDILSNSLAQVFSPIENQRYAIQRYEVLVPEGNLERLAYLIRFGTDNYPPLLACYHPLPDVFNIKDKALVFKRYWNRFVSPGEIVFLKGDSGHEIIEKYGRVNYLGVKKRNIKVWR